MFVSIQALKEAAEGNFENIPESERALVRTRLESDKRFLVKTEKNRRVKARQYCFYRDLIICTSMVKGGEDIILLPSFKLFVGALADQMPGELLQIEISDAEYDLQEGMPKDEDTAANIIKVIWEGEPAVSDELKLGNFDSILKKTAGAHDLPYKSPGEADFSAFAKGANSEDVMYAFAFEEHIYLYSLSASCLQVSECSGKAVYDWILSRTYSMHREEILQIESGGFVK